MRTAALAACLFLAALAGCRRADAGHAWSFERMLDQQRADAFAESPVFADGKAMRVPPHGTVPYGAAADYDLRQAQEDGEFRARVPLRVDRALLERGRARFDVFCAPCHGVAGDGESVVAEVMPLRKPPSLVAPPLSELRVGRIFQVVTLGYGLMPSYADELGAYDRWAVSAYVLALRKSRSTELAKLPEDVRSEFAKGGGR